MLGDPSLCVSGSAQIVVETTPEELFNWFTELDISRVLNGYGPLPGVDQTVDQSGPWTMPGQTRRLRMTRNISALQTIMICQPPTFFAYRVTEFTHVLDFLAHGAEARWWFDRHGLNATRLTWTYTFWPRSIAGKLSLFPVVKTIWTWYMQRTIVEMKRLAEQETVAG
jgi:hypothetical protein